MSTAKRGKVRVERGRYRLDGQFHFPYPNDPIRNEDGVLMGVTNPRDLTHVHMYGGEAPFFEGLSQGKLLGTRCDNSNCDANGSIFIPFRIHCPDCLMKNIIVDMTDTARKGATVHTFMITERTGAFNTLPKPTIPFAGLIVDRLQVAQHVRATVGVAHHPVDEVRPGQVEALLVETATGVIEQAVGLVAQQFGNIGHCPISSLVGMGIASRNFRSYAPS